jgi:NAD(P)-dependent dehydrogenase (short-subunit alcohol dehydrogenase family)
MPEYDFTDRVAFVTGGARGQGRSHAVAFAEHGADVVVVDSCETVSSSQYEFASEDELDETVAAVEDAGGEALGLVADVRDEAAVEAAVDRALDRFGRIDVLGNNAGVWSVSTLLDMDEEMFDQTMATNVKGTWLCSKHVGRHMVERGGGGRIVSTASATARIGFYKGGHYAASKNAILGLTKTLAIELADHGITVNAVSPSAVASPMSQGISENVGHEVFDEILAFTGPLNLLPHDESTGGLLGVEDATEAYLWLASDAARFVTGTEIVIDAGFTVK